MRSTVDTSKRNNVTALEGVALSVVQAIAADLVAPQQWPAEARTTIAQAAIALHARGRTWTQACAEVSRALDRPVSAYAIGAWINDSDELTEARARAREACAEALAEGTLEIADDIAGDVARDRLRVDVRQRLAAQLDGARWAKDRGAVPSGPASVSVSIQVAGDIAARLGD